MMLKKLFGYANDDDDDVEIVVGTKRLTYP